MNSKQSLEKVENLGRMDRVKTELQNVIRKLSAAIEKSHAEGRIPSDYSLGFANGAIFFEHQLSQKDGTPKFFDRTTSIGTLPIPIALRVREHVEKEYNSIAERARTQEQIFLQEAITTQARGVIEAMDKIQAYETEAEKHRNEPEPPQQLIREFTIGLGATKKAIEEFDRVMTNHEEARHVQKQHAAITTAKQTTSPVEQTGNEGNERMEAAHQGWGTSEDQNSASSRDETQQTEQNPT